MKTEQSLLKTPVEPFASFPGSAQVAGTVPIARRKATTVDGRRAATNVYADIPPSVYATFIATWTALLAVFWVTFAESPSTAFLLVVCTILAVMFFGVPIVMSRSGGKGSFAGPGLGDFLRGKLETINGAVDGLDALVQIVVVPACLTFGGVIISLIIDFDRVAF